MKYLMALGLLASLVLTPNTAAAQFSSVQTLSLPSALNPLPPIVCPPSTGIVGGGWTWCNTLQQYIQSYNDKVSQATQILSTMQQFSAYPVATGTGLGGQLVNWNSIVTQYENGNAAARQLNNKLFRSPSGLNPTQQKAIAQNEAMYGNLHDSIAAMLQQDDLISADDARDPHTVDLIRTAAANAKSPLQVQQMNVQLLGMMYNHMVQQSTEMRQVARWQAEYALEQIAKDKVQTEQAAQTVQSLGPIANPNLPANPH